jgi:hypothetical protein
MYGGMRFFIGLRLVEHIKRLESEAKSRLLAGLSKAIWGFGTTYSQLCVVDRALLTDGFLYFRINGTMSNI